MPALMARRAKRRGPPRRRGAPLSVLLVLGLSARWAAAQMPPAPASPVPGLPSPGPEAEDVPEPSPTDGRLATEGEVDDLRQKPIDLEQRLEQAARSRPSAAPS